MICTSHEIEKFSGRTTVVREFYYLVFLFVHTVDLHSVEVFSISNTLFTNFSI